MYQVDDEQPQTVNQPIETIHLYVVREGQKSPSIAPIVFSSLALVLLVIFSILTPYREPQEHKVIRIPAILLPLKTFTTSVPVVPTGIKTYPATTAHGILTITNGSILSEELPKGMILTGKDGAEVITDKNVFVPAGSATGLGYAIVAAHAVIPGATGNIAVLDINAVEGTALFIRNVQPFTGGADSYSVKYITSQDRATALSQARSTLLAQTLSGLLESPCKETTTGLQMLHVSWTCQLVSYSIPDLPGVKVLHAQVKGQVVILDVVFVARPQKIETK